MADLTITKDRMMKIDFSMPIENYGVVIILKKASSLENNMFVFLNSLSFEVWMCGAGALTLVIGVLWVIVQLRREANPSLSHCAWLCVASLVGQGTEDVPRLKFSVLNYFYAQLSTSLHVPSYHRNSDCYYWFGVGHIGSQDMKNGTV